VSGALAVVRKRIAFGLRLARDWRPTVAWAKSLVRSGVTNFVVLALTFWLVPGVRASGGPAALVELIVVLAVVGMAMRLVLLGVAVVIGGLGVLILGTVVQAIVMFTSLRLAEGVSVDDFGDAWVASWVAATFSALVNWLADAGSDDVFLGQALRQMARTPHTRPTEPGVLIIQLDGLSQPLLSWAVKAGNLPNLGRWLRQGSHTMTAWHTGVPSTTPASQAGILHGSATQIPAFRWYEKESGRLVVTNRPRDAAEVERRISDGRGLLADGGVSISNVFSGDAPTCLLTFSNASLPGRSARGYLAFVASPYGFARAIVLSIGEMLKEIQQARRQRRRDVFPRVARHGVYIALRAVTNVFLRDLNVALIAEQMSRGAPVIFCDFVDYDEVAHHAGPLRPESMQTLEGLDRVLGTLARLAGDAARDYEIVVLSDHGQSQGATFRQRYGESLDAVVQRLAGPPLPADSPALAAPPALAVPAAAPETPPLAPVAPARPEDVAPAQRRRRPRLGRRRAEVVPAQPHDTDDLEDWGRVNVLLDGVAGQGKAKAAAVRVATRAAKPRAEPERRERETIVTVASGNLAMVYLPGPGRQTLEEIQASHPELVDGLIHHPGIGLVVVESALDGPMAFGPKGSHRLRDGQVDGDDPLTPYGRHAARDLLGHQAMAHVGDLVLVSLVDPGTDEVAAFEELVGSHGGLGGWQTDAVLVHPASWPRDLTELVGPDTVYRQLVRWLEDLGLRADSAPLPSARGAPSVESDTSAEVRDAGG
jgi:hypothetical protein